MPVSAVSSSIWPCRSRTRSSGAYRKRCRRPHDRREPGLFSGFLRETETDLSGAPPRLSYVVHVGYSKSMFARCFLALAICTLTSPAYPQDSKHITVPRVDEQSCVPPPTYTPHPGDPPFGVHVQTTARDKNKRYILGVEYCEDGTFEFAESDQGVVSLKGTSYGTGSWWWQDGKSCTQIDAAGTDTKALPAECKEAGHWLGDHTVPVLSGASSAQKRGLYPEQSHTRHVKDRMNKGVNRS